MIRTHWLALWFVSAATWAAPSRAPACVGIDADGDGANACSDCDDADPTVYPGAPEACDGVDTDCDGWVGGFAEYPPTTWSTGHAGDGVMGNRVVVTTSTTLAQFGMELYAPPWVQLEWVVYERVGSSGDFTKVASVDTWSDGGWQWQLSPTLNVALVAGREYVVGVDPSTAITILRGTTTWGVVGGLGTAVEGVDDPAGETIPGTPLASLLRQQLFFGPEVDGDGDGFRACEDCDDGDDGVYPGAVEQCNGLDDDCDGAIDPSETDPSWDGDGDGYRLCGDAPADCNDADPDVYPGATELCNGVDDDCDGALAPGAESVDDDGDGMPPCVDCDDADPAVFVGAEEVCDGLDNDCDGAADLGEFSPWGPGSALPPAGTSGIALSDVVIAASTPVQSVVVSVELWHYDTRQIEIGLTSPQGTRVTLAAFEDGPYYFSGTTFDDAAATSIAFAPGNRTGSWQPRDALSTFVGEPAGGVWRLSVLDVTTGLTGYMTSWRLHLVTSGGDQDGDGVSGCMECDDAAPTSYPGAPEVCDGVDNDCDGALSDGEDDLDGDGFRVCSGDCNDASAAQRPGLTEICDGLDNDCDGVIGGPEGEQDADGDGVRACDGDCDDDDPRRSPLRLEDCDGIDSDCDPGTTGAEDRDRDGFTACLGDCDDGDPARSPGRAELCNGVDDDCDGAAPDEQDDDGDGHRPCDGDCDDTDPGVSPGAAEQCDGLDVDCSEGGVRRTFTPDVVWRADPGFHGVRLHVVRPMVLESFGVESQGALGAGDRFEVWAETDLGDLELRWSGAAAAGRRLDGWSTSPGLRVELDPTERWILGVRLARAERLSMRGNDAFPEEDDALWFSGGVRGSGPAGTPPDRFGTTALIALRLGTPDERDVDRDGVAVCEGDCDDTDPTVHPGALDVCDERDRDCDGRFPDCRPPFGCSQSSGVAWSLWALLPLLAVRRLRRWGALVFLLVLVVPRGAAAQCLDADADGYDDEACGGDDCDDADALVYPGAPETCDGIDSACDGEGGAWIPGPGGVYLSAGGPRSRGNFVTVGEPLSLESFSMRLGGPSSATLTWFVLVDQGGVGQLLAAGTTHPTTTGISDHASPSLGVLMVPGEQYVLGVVMDGPVSVEWTSVPALPMVYAPLAVEGGYLHADAVPAGTFLPAAEPYLYAMDFTTAGEVDADADGVPGCAGDCDDADSSVFPGAVETCDGRDEDCDGALLADELDQDGDGLLPCEGDCHPYANWLPTNHEACDGVDSDCDGVTPADEVDADGDGARVCHGDCADEDARVGPLELEVCDGVDNNCDGFLTYAEHDHDGDGQLACAGDCDDDDPTRHRLADEECNGIDDDCSGGTLGEGDRDGDGLLDCEDDDDDRETDTPDGASPAQVPRAARGCEKPWPTSADVAGCDAVAGCTAAPGAGGPVALLALVACVRRRRRVP